jgi:hypothetical protein
LGVDTHAVTLTALPNPIFSSHGLGKTQWPIPWLTPPSALMVTASAWRAGHELVMSGMPFLPCPEAGA